MRQIYLHRRKMSQMEHPEEGHQSRVRLMNNDIEEENTEKAEQRMNENGGGIARHGLHRVSTGN